MATMQPTAPHTFAAHMAAGHTAPSAPRDRTPVRALGGNSLLSWNRTEPPLDPPWPVHRFMAVVPKSTMLLNLGLLAVVACGALPPGPGPFPEAGIMPQPVPGAARALTPDGWKVGQTSPAARNCGQTNAQYLAVIGCVDSGQTGQSMCAYFDQELTRVLVRASCRMVDCVMSQSRLTMP